MRALHGSITLLGLLLTFLTLRYALSISYELTLPLVPGTTMASAAGSLEIKKSDLVLDPLDDVRETALREFFARQDRIVEIARQSDQLKVRTISDLNASFWLNIAIGLIGFCLSGWVWALKPKDAPMIFLMASGVSLLLFMYPIAIFMGRGTALKGDDFLFLCRFSVFFGTVFGTSLIGLFLVYPKRVRNWQPLFFTQMLLFIGTIAFILSDLAYFDYVNALILTMMLVICSSVFYQYRFSKRDPLARAALAWFGLSIIVGLGLYIFVNTIPMMLRLKPLHQGYGSLSFLCIYIGLIAGLTRFRLFDVGQWTFLFVFYSLGALSLLVLDAVLIYAFSLDRLPALSIALFLITFIYLPLRERLKKLLVRSRRYTDETLFSSALGVVFSPNEQKKRDNWQRLFKNLFEPLDISEINKPVAEVQIVAEGLSILVPSVAGLPALQISNPELGFALFNKLSVRTIKQVSSFIDETEANKKSYEQGVADERNRIAQDLHDDVGARLLNGLHTPEINLRTTIQEALHDVRSIVSGISGEKVLLSHFLADLRHETNLRCQAAGITLHWPLPDSAAYARPFDYRIHKNLGSSTREVVSNAIKHSRARSFWVDVRVDDEGLHFLFKDDGCGIPDAALSGLKAGNGLRILKQRIENLAGTVTLRRANPGTEVLISIPWDA